ncbi:hypothetical protein ACQKWADRAFT_307587 [Trichoderma austrokoningii]
MASPVIHNRGGPVQTAHPGVFTCSQSICSDAGCVDNSLQFECISQVKQGYDISFLGLIMECDGDTSGYPYLACTCIEDFVNCDDNGALRGQGSPSVVGANGYASATTVIGKKAGSAENTQAAQSQPSSKSAAVKLGWQLKAGMVTLITAALVL